MLWVPPVVLLVGIPLAAVVLARLDWISIPMPGWQELLLAATVQGAAVILLMRLWRSLLMSAVAIHISDAEAIVHIGMTLAGKYIPGKLWGLFTRGVLLAEKSPSLADTVAVSIAEQGVVMHAALVTAALSFGMTRWLGEGESGYFFLAAVLTAFSVVVVAFSLPRIGKTLANWFRFIPRARSLESGVWIAIAGKRYMVLLAGFSGYWVLNAGVLFALSWPAFSAETLPLAAAQVLMAVPVAVVAGFLALWLPGGIGVREGVLVALIAGLVPLKDAVGISLMFRCWCVGLDVCLGVAAVALQRRSKKSCAG